MNSPELQTALVAALSPAARIRPRLLLHRGVVEASALLFDTRLLTPEIARRRALTLWRPGATIYRLDEGLLLRLPVPCRMVCAVAPGLPLVRAGELLTAAPLTEAEGKRVSLPNGLLLVRKGEAVVTSLPESAREDPAAWLDLSGWRPATVVSLGTPPAPPTVVAQAATFDARAKLKGVPPADPQSAVVAQKLQAALRAQRESRTSPAQRFGATPVSPVRKVLWPMLERLAHLGEGGSGTASGQGVGGQNGSGRGNAPPRPGLVVRPQTTQEELNPFQRWLKHTAARTLLMTGLARQIGQKQADYMGRMIEMFEKGELDEALRHAIPLMGETSSGNLPPSLGVPSARSTLQVTSGTATSSYGSSPELYTDLRTLYRRAFEQLERQGRIEEAAFVLAELLHASAEAVAFLEKHDKLQLAAEIAEARTLPPELIVRQWLLAGNRDRALLIARRHQAFRAAVELLKQKDPEKAMELRRLWAQTSAEAGDYVAAIDLLWPDSATRAETLPWIEQALTFGGPPAARMLPRLLELTPDDPELQPRILALLAEEDPELALERKELAQSLYDQESAPRTVTLARAALRALARDAFLVPSLVDKELFRRLQSYGADTALRADLPSLPAETTGEALNQRAEPLALEWAAHDTGALALYDAAFLPNGRCLVALGEAGVRLLTRDGRTVAHFDQPAHRLVVADSGLRAIGIAPRGSVLRLARLDTANLRATHWCETTLQTFAPDYDGSLWFVATTTDLLAIDAVAEPFQALWRTPDLTGVPVQIARSVLDCSLLLRDPQVTQGIEGLPQLAETWWMWHFALPSLTMRDRQEQPPPDLRLAFTRGVAPGGGAAELRVYQSEAAEAERLSLFPPEDLTKIGRQPTDDHLQLSVTAKIPFSDSFYAQQAQPMQPILTEAWVAVPFRFDQGVCVRLYDRFKGKHRATLKLLGATLLTVRLNHTHLTLADDRGRLIVLDLTTGTLTRNLRLH